MNQAASHLLQEKEVNHTQASNGNFRRNGENLNRTKQKSYSAVLSQGAQSKRSHNTHQRNYSLGSCDIEHQPQHTRQPRRAFPPRRPQQLHQNSNYQGNSKKSYHNARDLDNDKGEYQSRHPPCHNCSETNHSAQNCHHQFQIKCSICNKFGHKTRLCP